MEFFQIFVIFSKISSEDTHTEMKIVCLSAYNLFVKCWESSFNRHINDVILKLKTQ